MVTKTTFSELGFRYSLVPEGIVLQVGPELYADISTRAASYPEARSRLAPLAYLGHAFAMDVSCPWGFDGNLRPYDAPAGQHAWLAAWPQARNVEAQLRATQVLAASVAVLTRFVRQSVQLAGHVGHRAPPFLPDLMIPVEQGSGAVLCAEFHRSAETWITSGGMRALESVSVLMSEIYTKLHPSPFVESGPRGYYARVGDGDHIELRIPIGNATGMATDSGHYGSEGYPIYVTGYNVDYGAQQLTLFAALIEIATMIEGVARAASSASDV